MRAAPSSFALRQDLPAAPAYGARPANARRNGRESEMRISIAGLLLCAVAAGCSQTPQQAASTAESRPSAGKTTATKAMTKEERCQEAINAAMRKRQNAAMAGSVLSAVGSFGGFAGRGGAIAGQAASVGGSIIASQGAGDMSGAMAECQ